MHEWLKMNKLYQHEFSELFRWHITHTQHSLWILKISAFLMTAKFVDYFCFSNIFWMVVMPFLCRDLSFLPKLSHHRNVSLLVHLPNLFFSCCQKIYLHLYKRSRMSSYLFTFFRWFSIKISCHNLIPGFCTNKS